jgi:16S rRNA (cytosine967-C5)-methyltransferase
MSPGPRASSRALALEAIRRVIDEGAYSNLVIPTLLGRSALDRRDRAFAAELAYGTLRHRLRLDAAIDAVASRPVDRMTPSARNLLRLGADQLLIAGVPAHAAVGETVALASGRERGFVNAVLRRLADSPPPLPEGDDDVSIGVRTGLAPWAVRELRRLVGEEVEAAAAAFARPAGLCLRTNVCATSPETLRGTLEAAGHRPRVGSVDPSCLLLDGGDPAALPGYDEGWFAVQDQASSFVVRVLDPRPGERVLDVCSAPGGKAIAAACLVGDDGLVVAADVRPRRVALIRSQATRLGVRPLLVAQDATAPALRGGFDAVLVDVPCSGIGSARRRPELLWRRSKDGLSELARTQVRIAAEAARSLVPGGRMVYSACTFPRAETEAACDAILRHAPSLEPLQTEGPDGVATRHRLWPHRHGSDGMFVAAFRSST